MGCNTTIDKNKLQKYDTSIPRSCIFTLNNYSYIFDNSDMNIYLIYIYIDR